MKLLSRAAFVAASVALTLVTVAGCAAVDTSLNIALASSLTPMQMALEESAAEVSELDVNMSTEGTATLITQILEGKPADILISADAESITQLTDANAVAGKPVALAVNQLVLAVASENPSAINALDALNDDSVTWVRCATEVPCGSLALRVIEENGISSKPLTETQNVAAAVALITSGEVDAGFVYATDVAASNGALKTVDAPELSDATATVTGVVLGASTHASVAKSILSRWASPEFAITWRNAGFTPVAGS